jgi:hypothetical protein
VEVKYDTMRGGWWSKDVGGPYGVGVWKCIQRGWDNFKQHVRFEVGNDSRVLFWQDVGCGELPLKILFPALFNIACAKEAWVEENMDTLNGVIHWNIMFIRLVHDWELDEVLQFFEFLYSQQVRHGGVNKICWIPLKRNNFEVKSYCQVREKQPKRRVRGGAVICLNDA